MFCRILLGLCLPLISCFLVRSFVWLDGWVQVSPKEAVAVQHYSTLSRVIDTPGCFKVPCAGMSMKRVSLARQSIDLPTTKVVDAKGNPLIVSALINYRVYDPKMAMFNVSDVRSYVNNNGTGVLKTVAGVHSYAELKTNSHQIDVELAETLQPLVRCAGVEIVSFVVNEMNYAPEIANTMLRTQAASALVESRHIIVQGAVSISCEAIEMLGTKVCTYEICMLLVYRYCTVLPVFV